MSHDSTIRPLISWLYTMNTKISWEYDEFRQVGKDYGDEEEVAIYDARHADFREVEAENARILKILSLKPDGVLIDFGSGTGVFAIQAARSCARVHAVDISQAMLDHARTQAALSGITNIRFHHAGFLNYEHEGSPVDAVVTSFALHHLPDFWKGVALKRIHTIMKSGAQLFIHDVILEDEDVLGNIAALIEKQAAAGGVFLREDAEMHFREEYSTYDWVMDGLLTHSGFTIVNKQIDDGVIGAYLCVRN